MEPHPSAVNLPVVGAAAPNRHYERIGGRAAISLLVEAFYRAMDTRPDARAIRALHEPDLSHTRGVLVSYLCEWMGGPREYSATRGAPRLRRRHQAFAIDSSARDAWLACMRTALDQTCPDAVLRDELMAAFAKIADFLRNTEDAEHGGQARPHPGRPMETDPQATPLVHASAAPAAAAASPSTSFLPAP